jgi:hypothetical protein
MIDFFKNIKKPITVFLIEAFEELKNKMTTEPSRIKFNW